MIDDMYIRDDGWWQQVFFTQQHGPTICHMLPRDDVTTILVSQLGMSNKHETLGTTRTLFIITTTSRDSLFLEKRLSKEFSYFRTNSLGQTKLFFTKVDFS